MSKFAWYQEEKKEYLVEGSAAEKRGEMKGAVIVVLLLAVPLFVAMAQQFKGH